MLIRGIYLPERAAAFNLKEKIAMFPTLPDDVLQRRTELPVKPAVVKLEGRIVRLEPVDIDCDTPPLFAMTNGSPITLGERHVDAYDADALIWRWLFGGPFADEAGLAAYLHKMADAPNTLAMIVRDRATDRQIGVACFMSNSPADLKIELGGICYSPVAQRTGANTEATYLMLKYCFGLGYRRLEWKCNALNERSRKAALHMGFKFEGIQDGHMIVKDRNRDTAWFRILASEWPDVRAQLERLLDR
jgi:RimJ/RimL family protein N-acetyltransferase